MLTATQTPTADVHPKSQLGWIKALVGISGVILLVAIVIRLLTPPTEPVPTSDIVTTNVTGSSTQFEKLTFVGKLPENFPTKLFVYQANNNITLASKIKNQLIEDFQLLQHPLSERVYQNQQYQLVDDEYTNQITFSAPPSTSENTTFDVDHMIAVAQEFFTSQNIVVTPDKSGVKYFSSETEVVPASNGEASIIEIPFSQTVDGHPIYFANVATHPFVAQLLGNDDILRITFSPQLLTLSEGQEYPLLTIDEALTQINSQQKAAFITVYSQTEGEPFDISKITSGSLTTIALEYRFDPATNYVLPYYRFAGTYQGANGTTLEGELITPAVVTIQQETTK